MRNYHSSSSSLINIASSRNWHPKGLILFSEENTEFPSSKFLLNLVVVFQKRNILVWCFKAHTYCFRNAKPNQTIFVRNWNRILRGILVFKVVLVIIRYWLRYLFPKVQLFDSGTPCSPGKENGTYNSSLGWLIAYIDLLLYLSNTVLQI